MLVLRLATNLKRIEQCFDEIHPNIELDDNGQVFIGGVYAWLDRLLRRGAELTGS